MLAGLAILAGVGLAIAGVLGYFYFYPPGTASLPASSLPPSPGPDVILQEPAPGSQVTKDVSFMVIATARDDQGVARIDLWVDDLLLAQQDSPDPRGLNPFSLVQEMVAVTPGVHALFARAYDSQGIMGESAISYINIVEPSLSDQEPVSAQYTIQEGDTLESIANKAGVSVQSIQAANPGIGKLLPKGRQVFIPGAIIPHPPLPVPPANASASMGAILPNQFPAQVLPGLFQPGALQVLPGLLPDWKQVIDPSNIQIKAPDSLTVGDIKDCKVIINWVDRATNEKAYLVYRLTVPGSIQPEILAELGPDSQTWKDTVPRPGKYGYKVAAKGNQLNQIIHASSNYLWVDVPPSPLCQEMPTYKQIHFQPLSFVPGGQFSNWFINVTVGGNPTLRIPEGQQTYLPVGDLKDYQIAAPAPESIYVKPDEGLRLEIEGNGFNGDQPAQAPQTLGVFFTRHNYGELTAPGSKDRVWPAKADNFAMSYKFWLDDWYWTGQGTNPLLPKPYNLRLEESGENERTLKWDHDPAHKSSYVSGFILYRRYQCPGEEIQIKAPRALPKDPQETRIKSLEEPAGCFCIYQVSAFGSGSETPPSEPLKDECRTLNPLDTLAVTFKDLSITTKTLPKPASSYIFLFANGYTRKSENLLISAGKYGLDRVALNSMPGNNQILVSLGSNQSLQLNFQVSNICRGIDLAIPKPGKNWEGYSNSFTLPSTDGGCQVTVEVNDRPGAAAGFPGEAPEPLKVNGAPCYRDDICQSGFCDDGKCTPGGYGIGGDYCHKNKHCNTGVCQCPDGWDGDRCKGWETFNAEKHGSCVDGRKNGDSCAHIQGAASHKVCASGYCADGKCTPPEGSGLGGDYCHNNAQCANFICICPNGYNGDFCKGYQNFTAEPGKHGYCTKAPPTSNGQLCWKAGECASKHCAEYLCAPVDYTGKAGEYCHHNNHCQSKQCKCPLGTDILGFCIGYVEASQNRGVCQP